MVLMYFQFGISPFTSTVILRDNRARDRRRDFGDVAACVVRLAASRLTLS